MDEDRLPSRRIVLAGLAAATVLEGAAQASPGGDPDLGPNVLVVDPAMPAAAIQARLDAIFAQQERAHFTDHRHAILFKPGPAT